MCIDVHRFEILAYTVQPSHKVTSAGEFHKSDSRATLKLLASNLRATLEQLTSDLQAILEQHASDLNVRYACVCEWLASKRQLGLHQLVGR